ncbi:TolB family protein [Effusibacillus lacus]|uniref:Dipeptidylpeptidase IV N-terminal domain-containing protein n=1 Tax=Effusibacillus lacus TaxID=1348429 RepID=A0A292YPL6_9BACL|nr:PD40 domain-containing protein [Effusibacillus lacus]TCS76345.1 WD40 repeat protein [Effusibacillus lacus]GAX91888.1 hypothetical protein EFBL_3579 [Effusibacillus lacus]
MNNEPWDQDHVLPPQLAKDLSSLRESIHTNELLRAKLRKQLLTEIAEAAGDRPRSPDPDNQRKQLWKLGPAVTAGVVLLGILAYNLSAGPGESQVKNVDVIQQRQLLTLNADSSTMPSPSVSSDMRFMAYERNNTIWIHGLSSGSSQELLSPPSGGSYRDPSFAPDGSMIAISVRAQDRATIATVSLRTRELRALTFPPPGFADIQPAYSRDGNYLAFIRTKLQADGKSHEDGELWVMKTDGSEAEKVIDHALEPAWSPDGKQLTFSRSYGTGPNSKRHIMTVIRNGTGEEKLAEGRMPAWSQNGQYIAYVSPKSEIWVMDVSGSGNTRLSMVSINTETDARPVWSGNGNSIFFVRRVEPSGALNIQQLDLMYK